MSAADTRVPGSFDGAKIQDLRLLLPKSTADYYRRAGDYDRIVACRFYENSEIVWLERQTMGRIHYIKHEWRARQGSYKRYIANDEHSDTPPRGARNVKKAKESFT